MTRYAPLWQQQNSYAASLDRLLIQNMWPAGGANGAIPTAVAGTMQVNVPAGQAVVTLQAGQGSALCVWDAPETVTIAAAPPSGQSRIDLVVLQVRDNALDAGPNNDFVFAAVAGTAVASNPVAPAVPTNAYAMMQVLVPGAAANLNTATLTDRRTTLAASGAQGQVPIGASFKWWSDTLPPAPPGVVFLFMRGQTVTGGVAAYPTLAARYPAWVAGNGTDLVIPDTRGRFMQGAAPSGDSSGPAVGSRGGATAYQLGTGNIPQFGVGLSISDPGHTHASHPAAAGNYYSTQGMGTTNLNSQALYSTIFTSGSSGTGIGGSVTFGQPTPTAVPTIPPFVGVHEVLRAA
jgi:hypothetical protein